MALEGCIRRFGKLLSSADIVQLRQSIADGMTETQAVENLLLSSYRDGVRILGQANRSGVAIAVKAQPVAEVIGIQKRVLEGLKAERRALHQQQARLLQTLTEMTGIEKSLRDQGINLNDDMAVMDELGRRLFAPRPKGDPANIGPLQGNDALTLLADYKRRRLGDRETLKAYDDVMKAQARLDQRVRQIYPNDIDAEAAGLAPRKEFFQGTDAVEPRLTVQHNLSAENLEFADGQGGLAMPSLSVQTEGNVQSGFGEIILIGDQDLGDPKRVPIHDSDAYSVTMPLPEYRKVKMETAQRVVDEMKPYGEKYGQPYVGAIDYTWDYSVNKPDPGKIISEWMRSTVAMGWFLETKGISTDPVVKDVQPRFSASWSESWLEFLKTDQSANHFAWDDPRRQNLYKRAATAYQAGMREHLTEVYAAADITGKDAEEMIAEDIKNSGFFDKNGLINYASYDQLRADATQRGKTKISDYDTSTYQEDLIRKHRLEREFKEWVDGKVLGMFEPPKLTLNGRKVDYNLDNIVRKMKAARLKGSESTLTFGPGNARAEMSVRIKSFDELRARAADQIRSEAEVTEARKGSEELLSLWRDAVVEFYTETDYRGNIDIWNALDDSMRSIAFWANNRQRMGSNEAMAAALKRNNFPNVTDEVVAQGVEAARMWLSTPVPYFEAKPRRAVKLEEFKGAVIPMDATPETRAILLRHGIPFKQYETGTRTDSQSNRSMAAQELMEQLNQRGERVFFQQSEIGFTSGLVSAAQRIPRESGTAADMLGSLKKQPGAKQDEIKWTGVEEWLYAKGGKITRDELVEFLQANGVQVEEFQYGEVPAVRAPKVRYEAASEGDYDYLGVEYGDFDNVRVWDVHEEAYGDWYWIVEDLDAGNVSVMRQETREWLDIRAPINRQTLHDGQMALEMDVHDRYSYAGPFEDETSYDTLVVDGEKENYREITLNLPVNERTMQHTGVIRFPGAGPEAAPDVRMSVSEAASELEADVEAEVNHSGQLDFEWAGDSVRFKNLPSDSFAKLRDIIQRPEYDGFGFDNLVPSLPFDDSPSFGGGHIGVNTLAWTRVDTREGPNGESILFIEEVQSDWHQMGKRHGYLPDARSARKAREMFEKAAEISISAFNEAEDIFHRYRDLLLANEGRAFPHETPDQHYQRLKYVLTREIEQVVAQPNWREIWESNGIIDEFSDVELMLVERYRQAELNTRHGHNVLEEYIRESEAVSDAPFSGNAWAELAIKRMIRIAVEEGHDQIAWTTGDQQRHRNDPGTYVKRIAYDPSSSFLEAEGLPGRPDANQRLQLHELPKWIGREATAKIQEQIDAIDAQYNIVPADVGLREAEGLGLGVYVVVDTDGNPVARGPDEAYPGQILVGANEADARQSLYQSLRQAGRLPELVGDQLRVGGHGFDFYDTTLVNIAQRAARKLDPAAKVRKFEGRLETGTKRKGDVIYHATQLEAGGDPSQPSTTGPWVVMAREPVEGAEGDGVSWIEKTVAGPMDQQAARAEMVRLTTENTLVTEEAVHVMDITPQMKEEALKGQTLFQKNNASIRFDEQNRALVRLSKSRNLSSFLHESGHLYLELMADMAEMENASDRHVNDFAKVLNFLGVNSREEITTEQHETFARAFEAYLQEGKAPDVNLRDIFTAFKAWLTWVYRRLRLEAELTDEIRSVFDRLVATDDAIANAERSQNMAAVFSTAEEAGMSPEVWAVYKGSLDRAHQEAVDAESKKMLAILQREQQTWWEDELEKVRNEVEAEAHAEPVYQALAMLQRGTNPDGSPTEMGPFKISRQSLLDAGYTPAFLKTLPRPWIYTAEGGVDVDVAAGIWGYTDGAALLEAVMKAPKMEHFIEAESRKRMGDMHPDPMVDGSLESDSVSAVYTTRRSEVLAAEMRALRKLVKADQPIVSATRSAERRAERQAREANRAQMPKRAELREIKAAANAAVAGLKVRDINPNRYQQAAQRAGRLAFEAMGRKDYQEAYDQKRRQIIQHETYRAAVKAKATADKTRNYLAKFDSGRVRKNLGRSDILAQIDTILDRINFRRISGAQIDREKAMKLILDQVEDGSLVIEPEALADLKDTGTNWQELTGNELKGLADTIRQLEHMARTEHLAMVNDQEVILQEAVDDVASSLLENNKQIDPTMSTETAAEAMKRHGGAGISYWLRPSSIARLLDNADWGAFTRRVVVPIRRAYAEKLIPMLHQQQIDVQEIYLKHYTVAELKAMQPWGRGGQRMRIEAMNENMSKADRLSMALNWGSEGNRAALRGGRNFRGDVAYPEAAIQQVLSSLDARDWAFVQEMWDYLDSYWGQLSEAERRRRGVAPQKVEAAPFTMTSSDGETVSLRGGYYPLKYDPRQSRKHKADQADDLYKKLGNGVFISAQTRAGSTHERVQNHGLAVRLGLRTIDLHLREVIRDIAIGDEVNFVKRLLNDPDVDAAFKETGNENAQRALNLWLTDAAIGELPADDIINKSATYLRTGWTKAKIGLNMLTTALQQTGQFQSMAVIGSKYWAIGVGQVVRNPNAANRLVMEQSNFMRTRYQANAWDKDVADAAERIDHVFKDATLTPSTRQKLAKAYFLPIMKMQQTVDVSTWLGAKDKGLDRGMSEAEAILYADSQVEAAQTSGFFSDRSGIERGTVSDRIRQNQFIRLWTTVISYMLAKGNLAYEKGHEFAKKPTLWGASQLMADIFLLFTMEAMMASVIYGRFPWDEDDPWELLKFAAKETGLSAVSGVPVIREVPAARFRSGNTPLGAVSVDLLRAWDQTLQGEVDRPFTRAYTDAAGTLLHLPSNQLYRTGDAFWADFAEGEDVTFLEYLTGRRE